MHCSVLVKSFPYQNNNCFLYILPSKIARIVRLIKYRNGKIYFFYGLHYLHRVVIQ